MGPWAGDLGLADSFWLDDDDFRGFRRKGFERVFILGPGSLTEVTHP